MRLGLLSLRCTLGLVSITHGLPKLLTMESGSPSDTAALFEANGLNPTYALTVTTGIVEVLGRALLTIGAYTFWSSLLLVAINLTIGWKLYLQNGFFINWSLEANVGHGYEFTLLLIAGILYIMLAGPGTVSADGRRARRKAAPTNLSQARLKTGRL